MKRVLVTGATGLIGAWLVKKLVSEGMEVIALIRDLDPQSELFRSGDHQRISIVSGCLEDYWTIERAINAHDIDTVFHLAAQPIVNVANRSPLPTFESNIRGTYNLLEACRQHRELVQCVVIASSDKAYGSQQTLPYTEDMPLQGKSPYEVSKSCADLIAHSYACTYQLPIAIARCGNVFGGGDLNWSRIVPHSIRSCLEQVSPVIRSDGLHKRDYIYVKDIVDAYICLADNLTDEGLWGAAFNFGPNYPMTVLEVVAHVQNLMKATQYSPDIQNSAQGEIYSQYLDSSKAEARLKWKPRYSFDAGLRETIEWYSHYFRKGQST